MLLKFVTKTFMTNNRIFVLFKKSPSVIFVRETNLDFPCNTIAF